VSAPVGNPDEAALFSDCDSDVVGARSASEGRGSYVDRAVAAKPLSPWSCGKIPMASPWEGEAPAEPLGGKPLIQNGSAGASPSRIFIASGGL